MARLHAGQIEQVLDEAAHPQRLVVDDLDELAALLGDAAMSSSSASL